MAIDLGTAAGLFPDFTVWASSDEPDNGVGDGNTTGDVNGAEGFSSPVDVTGAFVGAGKLFDGVISLRSERAGPGDGREYTVTGVLDGSEDFGPRELDCSVEVPHDQGG